MDKPFEIGSKSSQTKTDILELFFPNVYFRIKWQTDFEELSAILKI